MKVLNGTTVYSPSFQTGSTYIAASGNTLIYATNDSGNYVFQGGNVAKLLRTDIPVANGVVHVSASRDGKSYAFKLMVQLIGDFLASPHSDRARADEAYVPGSHYSSLFSASAASSIAAESQRTLTGVIGTIIPTASFAVAAAPKQSFSHARAGVSHHATVSRTLLLVHLGFVALLRHIV